MLNVVLTEVGDVGTGGRGGDRGATTGLVGTVVLRTVHRADRGVQVDGGRVDVVAPVEVARQRHGIAAVDGRVQVGIAQIE
ncbi:hypothetical protein D3C73_1440960 [compost metagenome]